MTSILCTPEGLAAVLFTSSGAALMLATWLWELAVMVRDIRRSKPARTHGSKAP